MKRPFCACFTAASLLVTMGCGTTSDTSSDSTTTTTTGQFALLSPLIKSLAGGQGGADVGPIVVAADFDGDGKSDFAALNAGVGSVSIFRSNGADFDAEQLVSTATTGRALTSADLNGDGKPDLIVVSPTLVCFLFNNGSGVFFKPIEVALGSDNQAVFCADMDGDSRLDVAVADAGAVPLHILYGDGTANPVQYLPLDFTTSANTIQSPRGIVVADFDLDGKRDLAFCNGAAGYLTLWINQGGRAGAFPSGTTVNSGLELPSGYVGRGLATGDFNADGRPDLACSGWDGASGAFAQVLLNTATGIHTTGLQGVSPDAQQVAVGDFNLDGAHDVVVISRLGYSNAGNAESDFLLGNGQGGLNGQIPFALVAGQRAAGVATGDFNGDGRLDVVAVGPGAAYIVLNQSTTQ